jgi:hypothetical protein
MNAEQILSYARQKGVVLIPDGDRIKYKAPSGIMTPDLVEAIRKNKQAILSALSQRGGAKEILHKNTESKAGDCDQCPAAGYWDNAQYAGQGLLCFHYAYYLGKSGKPKPCAETWINCPRKATL